MKKETEGRPQLRDCPFCKASGKDDEKVLFIGNLHICHDCEYVASYTIVCTMCGASITDEYRDEVVRLWNGEDKPADDIEAAPEEAL